MSTKTAVEMLLSPGQLRVADEANKRVSRFRSAIIKSKYDIDRKTVEDRAFKKFKIDQLKKKIRKLELELKKAENTLDDAEERAAEMVRKETAMSERLRQKELNEELLRSTKAAMTVLAASLPPDLRNVLEIGPTCKMLTAEAVAEVIE